MTNTALVNSSGTTLNSHGYVCNAAGQRTEQVRTDGSDVLYTYDNDGQVVTAIGSGGQSTENLGYLYDAAWNLNHVTNNGSLSTLSVDSQNQLTTANGNSCTYDSNGNLTQGHYYLSYSYDDENELTQVTDTIYHTFQTQFVYDGLGRRRRKVEYTWNSTYGLWQVSGETRYIYDGRNVIQERDGSNNPLVAYTRGNDLSGTLQGAGGIGGLLGRSSGYSGGSWSTHDYYHADANGNVTYLVDSSQNMAAYYRYNPFGNTIASGGTLASANVYQFSSKESHPNSFTYYYGFRFYDPTLQRFLNRDPIEERGERNLYRFVGNSPVNKVDLLGLEGNFLDGYSDKCYPPAGARYNRAFNLMSCPPASAGAAACNALSLFDPDPDNPTGVSPWASILMLHNILNNTPAPSPDAGVFVIQWPSMRPVPQPPLVIQGPPLISFPGGIINRNLPPVSVF